MSDPIRDAIAEYEAAKYGVPVEAEAVETVEDGSPRAPKPDYSQGLEYVPVRRSSWEVMSDLLREGVRW